MDFEACSLSNWLSLYRAQILTSNFLLNYFIVDDMCKYIHFNLEDQERPGRPSITDEDQIKTLIENMLYDT